MDNNTENALMFFHHDLVSVAHTRRWWISELPLPGGTGLTQLSLGSVTIVLKVQVSYSYLRLNL